MEWIQKLEQKLMGILLSLTLKHGMLVTEIFFELEGWDTFLIPTSPQSLHQVGESKRYDSFSIVILVQNVQRYVTSHQLLCQLFCKADTLETGVHVAAISQVLQSSETVLFSWENVRMKRTVIEVLEEIIFFESGRHLQLLVDQDRTELSHLFLSLLTWVKYLEWGFLILRKSELSRSILFFKNREDLIASKFVADKLINGCLTFTTNDSRNKFNCLTALVVELLFIV